MHRRYGSQSMIAPLRRVLVKRPDAAFAVDDPIKWHYTAKPELELAQQEHDALVGRLQQAEVEVLYHDEAQPGRADAIYVFDPALITDEGAIILKMGKALRRGEEAAMARRLALRLEYDGSGFSGSQFQPERRTVQGTVG